MPVPTLPTLPNQSHSKDVMHTTKSMTKIKEVVVHTVLGQNIKNTFNVLRSAGHVSDSKGKSTSSSSMNRFQRNIYEFDLNLNSINDIPTTIQRSKAVSKPSYIFILF